QRSGSAHQGSARGTLDVVFCVSTMASSPIQAEEFTRTLGAPLRVGRTFVCAEFATAQPPRLVQLPPVLRRGSWPVFVQLGRRVDNPYAPRYAVLRGDEAFRTQHPNTSLDGIETNIERFPDFGL